MVEVASELGPNTIMDNLGSSGRTPMRTHCVKKMPSIAKLNSLLIFCRSTILS